ncbi:MAG: alpha/beta fold hydrolase [Micavibrio aeruginosavorus]|uniref:Alpha/beta fold hydrolase n=1 Tax=Micavibrio aeruginosavorus TaxID=349221 RepID=A0A7T5UHN8_9BACT|nr:MAG: alpha/beta fold hydrolase [Micavibrio aeruginosavorus]
MVVLGKIVLAWLVLLGLVINHSAMALPPDNCDTVVILHGIARTNKSMIKIEKALRDAGYNAISITYPSTEKDVDELAQWLHQNYLTAKFWENNRRVHFVTHSMGGLVTREYLEKYRPAIPYRHLGRVVMLAPPHQGSEVADLLDQNWLYQMYYGPAGQDLTTDAQKSPHPRPYYDLGIIAGNKEWPYFAAAFVVPGPGDGRVAVEKTRLPGMADHIIVNATHTFIMNDEPAIKQALYFLTHGEFQHEQSNQ